MSQVKEVRTVQQEHCHLRPEQFSIRLHEAIAAKLRDDQAPTIAIARKNIARWREIHKGTGVIYYLNRWQNLLQGPLDEFLAFMVSSFQEARDMRQCSPFAGLLSPRERWGIMNNFQEEWKRGHTYAKGRA